MVALALRVVKVKMEKKKEKKRKEKRKEKRKKEKCITCVNLKKRFEKKDTNQKGHQRKSSSAILFTSALQYCVVLHLEHLSNFIPDAPHPMHISVLVNISFNLPGFASVMSALPWATAGGI